MEQLITDVRTQIRARKPAWTPLTHNPVVQSRKHSMETCRTSLFLRIEPSARVRGGRTQSTMITELEAQCEVLTLFTILARLDVQAWRDQVVEIWKEFTVAAGAAVQANAPFALGLDVMLMDYALPLIPADPFKGLEAWAASPRNQSSSYQEVVSRAATFTSNYEPPDVPVRMVLDFPSNFYKGEKELWLARELLAISTSIARLEAVKSWWKIQEVAFASTFAWMASAEALVAMTQVMDDGIMVRDLPAISCIDAVILLDTTQRMMPSCQATTTFPGIVTLLITDRAPWEANLAVLSALVYSRSVHRVELQSSPPNERHLCYTDEQTKRAYWRWIAYAVFSRESHHKVREIVANQWSVDAEELAMMREVLDAEDPLAVLMEETRDAAVDTAVVCASQFYFSAPSETPGREAADYTSGDALLVLTVKKVGDLGWSVVLPGYGKAWVRACDGVVAYEVSPSLRPALDVTCVSTNTMTAIALCSAVGARARTLHLSMLDTSSDRISDAWIRAFLSQCPLLEELTVSCGLHLGHLAAFVTTPGAPRLRKLNIANTIDYFYEDERFPTEERATVFWEALASSHHPLARSLEYLDLYIHVCAARSAGYISEVRTVLDSNRRLHAIKLGFQSRPGVSAKRVQRLVETLEEDYQTRCEDEGEVECTVPLPMRARLGFLSALSRNQLRVAQLDSGVLATVFEFAATTRPRRFECDTTA